MPREKRGKEVVPGEISNSEERDRLAHPVYATRSHKVLDMQDEYRWKRLDDRDLLAQARRTNLHGLWP